MLSFQIAVLDTAECTPEVIASLEISAFFREEADLADLPLDQDEARNHYINGLTDEDLKADYIEEPGIPDGLLMEDFRNEVGNSINDRIAALGGHYPFEHTSPGVLVRRPIDEISAVGASYLALQFYRALKANRVEIIGDNPQGITESKGVFRRTFANLFECIAGYTVAGDKGGVPYMTSTARSSRKFHRLLTDICVKIGDGRVKDLADFNEEQKNTNDGKVDCFVHVGQLPLNGVSSIFLVGASVQNQSVEHKIMCADKIRFAQSFFNRQPAAFFGALVRPQDEDVLTRDKCVTRNCLLYCYDKIWKNMGKRGTSEYETKAMRHLDRTARSILKKFKGAAYEDDFDRYLI